MCMIGLHSEEWDYDYAGMELEHLEDIPWDRVGRLGSCRFNSLLWFFCFNLFMPMHLLHASQFCF